MSEQTPDPLVEGTEPDENTEDDHRQDPDEGDE